MKNRSSKKTVRALCLLGSAVILALCCITPALTATRFVDDDDDHAATLRVDDDKVECRGAGYTSIQAAINAASPGDKIEVCPGIYKEQLEITKRLTLEGIRRAGKNAAVVQPVNAVINATDIFEGGVAVSVMILVRDTRDVTIKNIIVDGINNNVNCAESFLDGIFFKNASGKIESVVVANMLSPEGCAGAFAVDFESEGGRRHLTVQNSSLHDYDFLGIFAFGPGTTLHAIGNVISGRGLKPSFFGQGAMQLNGTKGVIEENVITNHLTLCDPTEPTPACDFSSHGIFVFTNEVSILRNIVGKNNDGILAGFFGLASNGIKILENRVFDHDFSNGTPPGGNGIFVGEGENNIVRDNIITNSDNAGIFVTGSDNTIRDNTINEAAIGLLVSPGNKLSDNRFFNTPVIRELFDPGAPLASSQRASSSGTNVPALFGRRRKAQ
jgi:parallel beta-helix repeat protein